MNFYRHSDSRVININPVRCNKRSALHLYLCHHPPCPNKRCNSLCSLPPTVPSWLWFHSPVVVSCLTPMVPPIYPACSARASPAPAPRFPPAGPFCALAHIPPPFITSQIYRKSAPIHCVKTHHTAKALNHSQTQPIDFNHQ